MLEGGTEGAHLNTIIGFKLLRVRKDKSLSPLFINPTQRIPVGKWLKAEEHRTSGFAFRPGWHACAKPYAPHLSKKGRVWCRVSLRGVQEHHRPAAQGGLWYIAEWMRIETIDWRL